ncbi:SCP2 domain-containing protein [Pseudomonadota bacterium]
MKLPDTLLAIIESTANRVLQLDIDSHPALEQLDGKTFALQLRELSDRLLVLISNRQTRWYSDPEAQVDLTLVTDLPTLMRLSLNDPPVAKDIARQVVIQGDPELGKMVLELLAKLQLDWEEHLSRKVGDFPARKMGNLARGVHAWSLNTRHALGEMIANFLQEESRLLVPRWRVENFIEDVGAIEKQTDDLEMRMQQLRNNSRNTA